MLKWKNANLMMKIKAPTHINEAYEWFKDYCIDQGIIKRYIPTKKKLEILLIRYQETSEHGAVWGKAYSIVVLNLHQVLLLNKNNIFIIIDL